MPSTIAKGRFSMFVTTLRALGLGVGLAASAVLVTGCSESAKMASAKSFDAALSELPVYNVEETVISKETYFDGVVEAVNQAVVSAQTSGRIIELPFDVGDYVAQGDVIARFTDTEQKAAVAAARAQLEEAKARFAEADKQLKRVSDVYERALVAKADYDQAVAAQAAASARVESAQAALENAQERLSHTMVIAPYSGIVVKRLTDVGATVAPGSPLLEGLSLNHLRVQVDIPQQHIAPLHRLKKARVILANGDSVDVTSMRIPPQADVTTHSFRVLLQLPEEQYNEPVFPGTLVKVAFVTGEHNQLLLPEKAIAQRGEVTGVYVVAEDNSALEFRYVRLGRMVPGKGVVVMAGMQAGDKVALDTVAAAAVYKSQTFEPAH